VPDDKLYAKSKQFRDKVARGNTVLSLQMKNDAGVNCEVTCFVVFAIRKFTGGMGDDDDDDEYSKDQWKNFFISPPETARSVVSTTKENGAAAHMAAVKIGGEYLVIGQPATLSLFLFSPQISCLLTSIFVCFAFIVCLLSSFVCFHRLF